METPLSTSANRLGGHLPDRAALAVAMQSGQRARYHTITVLLQNIVLDIMRAGTHFHFLDAEFACLSGNAFSVYCIGRIREGSWLIGVSTRERPSDHAVSVSYQEVSFQRNAMIRKRLLKYK